MIECYVGQGKCRLAFINRRICAEIGHKILTFCLARALGLIIENWVLLLVKQPLCIYLIVQIILEQVEKRRPYIDRAADAVKSLRNQENDEDVDCK